MFIVAPIARSPDWCMSSGREPIASPPGSATWACRQRPISGPSTHTDARSRPTAGKSAWNDSSAGVVIDTVSPSSVTSAAQTAQHVGHQRDVQDLRAVGDHGGALGQQRGRHQLQHAVLGAGHLDGAGEPGSAGDQEAFHGWHSNRHGRAATGPTSRRAAGRSGARRRVSAMAVHLTRIYTRTGDDGTTGLADFSRVSKTDPRLVAYADCDETNATLGLVMALGRPAAADRAR